MPKKGSCFSSDFYSKVSYEYQIALAKLSAKIANNPKHEMKLLDEFSTKYLMPKDLWKRWFELLEKEQFTISKDYVNLILQRAQSHLYYDWVTANDKNFVFYTDYNKEFLKKVKLLKSFFDLKLSMRKHLREDLDLRESRLKECERELEYPNEKIRHSFMLYEQYSTKAIAFKTLIRFREMENLYSAIIAAQKDKNWKHWFNLLTETKDSDFIKQNTENQLGRDIFNKELWELYFEYLETANPKELLRTYSKYCRFFTDDEDTKRNYQEAWKQYGPVDLEWKTLFEFEKDKVCDRNFVKNSEDVQKSLDVKLNPQQTAEGYLLPSTIVNYTISKALSSSSIATLKLQKCQKRFWAMYPIPICYGFTFARPLTYKDETYGTLFIDDSIFNSIHNKMPKDVKYHISTSLTVSDTIINKNLACYISTVIHQCNAKYIEIEDQQLFQKDFEFLIGHGGVELLKLDRVRITKDNEEQMAVEEILDMTPKIRFFSMTAPTINNPAALSDLKFVNKIMEFYLLAPVRTSINPDIFWKFLKKNAAPSASFTIQFYYSLGYEFVQDFHKILEQRLQTWEPLAEAPRLSMKYDYWRNY